MSTVRHSCHHHIKTFSSFDMQTSQVKLIVVINIKISALPSSMNSDTVFSLLKLEAWHSSKSTTRMSRRVSVLKLLAWPPVPGTRGPSRKLASSSASRWSAGLAPDPVALATVPLLPPGGASTPLVPILNPSSCLELFTVKLFTAHHHFARCCGCATLRLHPHSPLLLLLSHPDIMSVKSEIEKLLLISVLIVHFVSTAPRTKSKIKDDFQKFLVLKCLYTAV